MAQRRDSSGRSWLVSLSLLLVLSLPLLGLSPLLAGVTWWFSSTAVMALVLGAAVLVRAIGLPPYLPVLASIVAWMLISTLVFAPGTAAFWIFPTRETIETLVAGFQDAGASIQVQHIPAQAVPSLLQLISMVTGLLAVLADVLVFGLRLPALTGLIPVVILTVPHVVQDKELDVVLFIVVSASFLLFLWLAARVEGTSWFRHHSRKNGTPHRPRRSGRAPAAAVGVGAAAIVVALVVPNVTPGLTADAFQAQGVGNQFPSVYAMGVDPFIQLGRDLRRTAPVLSLSYTTSAPGPLYLKLVNLTDFHKGTWGPESLADEHGVANGVAIEPAPGLDPAVPTEMIDSTISIAALRSDWLPVPYPTTTLNGLRGQWIVSSDTLTVTRTNQDARRESYGVSSLEVEPTAEQLAAAGTAVPPDFDRFLSLPDDLPPIIDETALRVTASATTNYDKAVALQKYFTSGEFAYSVQAPVDGDFDGSNGAAMASFLEVKSGYCVHFASTMAVMARQLGIPSRVAIGYFPGDSNEKNSDGTAVYNVTTDQLHAWPELYFEGIGWLPFEPTPSLGITPPPYSLPNFALSGGAAGTTADDPAVPAPNAATDDPSVVKDGATGQALVEAQALDQLRGWLTILGAVVLAVLLSFVPAVVRRFKRARSRRLIAAGRSPGTAAWQELHDVANDYRFEVTKGDTPRIFADRLRQHVQRMPPADLELLLAEVEREQFAERSDAAVTAARRTDIQRALDSVVSALDLAALPGERRRARYRPASLWVNRRIFSAEE